MQATLKASSSTCNVLLSSFLLCSNRITPQTQVYRVFNHKIDQLNCDILIDYVLKVNRQQEFSKVGGSKDFAGTARDTTAIHQSSRRHQVEDNGGFSNFKLLLVIQNTRDMAQVFESLSYKVRSPI